MDSALTSSSDALLITEMDSSSVNCRAAMLSVSAARSGRRVPGPMTMTRPPPSFNCPTHVNLADLRQLHKPFMNNQQPQLLTPTHSTTNSHDYGKSRPVVFPPSSSSSLMPTPSSQDGNTTTNNNGSNLQRTVSRESASRTNPVLAPFSKVSSNTSSYHSAHERSESAISLDSPFKRAPVSNNPRKRYPGDEFGPGARPFFPSLSSSSSPAATSRNSLHNLSSSAVPVLQVNDETVNDENGSLAPVDSTQTKNSAASVASAGSDSNLSSIKRWHSGGSSSSTAHFSAISAINSLKHCLEKDVVMRLDLDDFNLEAQVESFQDAINQLQKLKTTCVHMIEKYREDNKSARSEMENGVNRLMEIKKEFFIIDQLDERLKRARSNVEDCKKRLDRVNQRVGLQENDNKQRNQRIKYLKRGSLGVLIVLCLLTFIIEHYFWHYIFPPKPLSFDEIIACLENFEICSY